MRKPQVPKWRTQCWDEIGKVCDSTVPCCHTVHKEDITSQFFGTINIGFNQF